MTSGTILIKQDAPRPQCFQLDGESFPNGWMAVAHKLPPLELEKELLAGGWTFFYMANGIR
ncbi:MAG: hypothetical protein NTY38_33160, partial [Acidobacteria bacterium]|nr:hypothetical protein [Acidobacteriota bacterium]